jgi:hypothetical protein
VRDVFKRALRVPKTNLEGMWREYVEFESSHPKSVAKVSTEQMSPVYLATKRVARELENMPKRGKSIMARPPLWTASEKKQVCVCV